MHILLLIRLKLAKYFRESLVESSQRNVDGLGRALLRVFCIRVGVQKLDQLR